MRHGSRRLVALAWLASAAVACAEDSRDAGTGNDANPLPHSGTSTATEIGAGTAPVSSLPAPSDAAGTSTTSDTSVATGGGPSGPGPSVAGGGMTNGEPVAGGSSSEPLGGAGDASGGASTGGMPSPAKGGSQNGGDAAGNSSNGAAAGGNAAGGAEPGGAGGTAPAAGGGANDDAWIDLFNGVDLEGWVAHDGGRGNSNSVPIEDVFQVMDGEIAVYQGAANGSTQVFANLRNETVLGGNYVLHVEYRWGENKFAPRASADRDAGILFHITGSDVGKVFPDSLEMQIGDSQLGGDYVTGDLWVLGVPTVASVTMNGMLTPVGDVGGASVAHYTDVHAENPHGEWNVCEITVDGAASAIFTLNGVEVHRLYDFTYQGQPLEEGFISVQAEWAEIFYRNIRYMPL